MADGRAALLFAWTRPAPSLSRDAPWTGRTPPLVWAALGFYLLAGLAVWPGFPALVRRLRRRRA
ncbi:MAG: hypothetical protein U1F87_15845 [Kiritimatiellia bacterium]